jgi:elongation factor Ts
MSQIQELRNRTGAGIVSCSKALGESGGDIDKAILILRQKGESRADGYGSRETKAGGIGVYLHHDRTAGVLVQLSCETDFVARTPEFQELANNIAMHVMASSPSVVALADLPESLVDLETQVAIVELERRGMTGEKLERALTGKVNKVLAEKCLLDQPFVVDQTITVGQAVKAFSSKCGEKIEVTAFSRLPEVGKPKPPTASTDYA